MNDMQRVPNTPRVGFVGRRWLGFRCYESLLRYSVNGFIDLVAVDLKPSARQYPGEQQLLTKPIEPIVEAKDMKHQDVDLVVSVLADYIFKPEDLAAYAAINLHPAPLPEYRGCNSYSWAIENEDEYYGVSLHEIDTGIDTGRIIAQRFLPINDEETAWSLYKRSQVVAHSLFESEIEDVLRSYGHPLSRPQDEARARYYKRSHVPVKEERFASKSQRAWFFPGFE